MQCYLWVIYRLNKNIIIAIIIVAASLQQALGQAYFANGDARSIGNQCYELTSASNNKLGSVWYADKLNLQNDFDLEFNLNFGQSNAGADGIVFVLQTVGNKALGNTGGGIGFEGFSPSFGIEFDTYQNTSYDDLTFDHVAMFRDGSVNHRSNNALSTQVSALKSQANIEDGKEHLVRIKWDASRKNITLWFDCELRLTEKIDLIDEIFDGTSEVFWGFTAATGGANNRQVACLRDDILLSDTVEICKGNSIVLNSRKSSDDSYLWTPNIDLNNATIQKPTSSTIINRTYIVQFKDLCNEVISDTVTVKVSEPFVMDVVKDTLMCDGRGYRVDLRSEFDSVRWSNGSRALFQDFKNAGSYKVTAWRGTCYDHDSFELRTNNTPSIEIVGDSIFCENDLINLTVNITPNNATYKWHDDVTQTNRTFSSTQNTSVFAENECGIDVESKFIREITLPIVDIGPDTLLCLGDNITLASRSNLTDTDITLQWNDGSTNRTSDINEGGLYWLEATNKICSHRDSIVVTDLLRPILEFDNDILLCRNERIVLDPGIANTEIVWNGVTNQQSFILFNYEGSLTIRAENDCGIDSAKMEIELKDCFCDMFFPTAVSPNNDDLNEIFRPTPNCNKLRNYELTVYNRWGEQLFHSEDINKTWDLKVKNQLVQPGLYLWIVDFMGFENGLDTRKKQYGYVHVVY